MTQEQLEAFLKKHGMDPHELAELIGLSGPAVDHWITGRRTIARPYGRLLRLFDKYPRLMQEYK